MSHSFVGLELAGSLKYGREMLPSWISIDVVGNQLHTGSSDKIGRWDIICHRHGVASWFEANHAKLSPTRLSTAPRTRSWTRVFTFVFIFSQRIFRGSSLNFN